MKPQVQSLLSTITTTTKPKKQKQSTLEVVAGSTGHGRRLPTGKQCWEEQWGAALLTGREPFPELNITVGPPAGLVHPSMRGSWGLSVLLLAVSLGLWPAARVPLDFTKWSGHACHTSALHTEPSCVGSSQTQALSTPWSPSWETRVFLEATF